MVADIAKKSLIIVESPKKANTIQGFLKGYPFKVMASKGHVMDLNPRPSDSDGSTYGVYIRDGYRLDYIIPDEDKELLSELKRELEKVDQLILATDEDREGESIAYHLKMLLSPKVPTYRMVFHEITKKAIEEAFENCRDIDMDLVMAQEARRVVDRLQGYGISPILIRKLGKDKLSAGRVQSPALKLIVEREKIRRKFKVSGFYSVEGTASFDSSDFSFSLSSIGKESVANSKSYDKESGEFKDGVIVLDKERADEIARSLEGKSARVISNKKSNTSEKPSEPFTTSTLQQDAGSKLRMSSKEVMMVAQSLYENGYITYMRTDSPNLSSECIKAARAQAESLFGKEYLNPIERNYKARTPGAQEAHEAIRPAGDRFRSPNETGLRGKELDLYTLIWKRTLATQMKDAEFLDTKVKLECEGYILSSGERKCIFDGFIRLYRASDEEEESEESERALPNLNVGDSSIIKSSYGKEHATLPPKRYTEPSLVKKLESDEIGRPSTYAQIISTLLDRDYVVKEGLSLVPTFTGFFVEKFMEEAFPKYIDYGFTKKMEAELDKIASGEMKKDDYLNAFWFGEDYKGGLVEKINMVKRETLSTSFKTLELSGLQKSFDENGKEVSFEIKMGKFGPYILTDLFDQMKGKYEMASINEKKYFPGEFSLEDVLSILNPKDNLLYGKYIVKEGQNGIYIQREDGVTVSWYQKSKPEEASEELLDLLFSLPKELGEDDVSKAILNYGKYGFYVAYNGKNYSLFNADPLLMDFDSAKSLFEEKSLGEYNGNQIYLKKGKYGFYLQSGGVNYKIFRSDGKPEDIDEKKAISIIERKEKREGEAVSESEEKGSSLGEYEGWPVRILTGRYGPYIKWNSNNYRIGKSESLSELTLDRAVSIIEKKDNGEKKAKSPKKALKAMPKESSPSLGEYKGNSVLIMTGKYGPYIKWNSNNYKISKEDGDLSSLSLDKAIEIIERAKDKKSSQYDFLEKAIKVWNLDNGERVGLFVGKYGPYLREGKSIFGLKGDEKKNPEGLTDERVKEIVSSQES